MFLFNAKKVSIQYNLNLLSFYLRGMEWDLVLAFLIRLKSQFLADSNLADHISEGC